MTINEDLQLEQPVGKKAKLFEKLADQLYDLNLFSTAKIYYDKAVSVLQYARFTAQVLEDI